MSNLREELNRKKEKEKEIVSEAAYGWVKNNIIILSEKINRRDIERLISSIDKFQNTFSSYSGRLPALAQCLEDVEDGLQKIVIGKRSGDRATEMLKYMTYMYNTFSTFFKQDIPVLSKTKIFKLANENADVPMKDLANAKEMMMAFKTALRPDANQIKLIKKIYRDSALPELPVDAIAQELISLSLNELKGLEGIEKVPMVATEMPVPAPTQPAPATPAPSPIMATEELLRESIILKEAIDMQDLKQVVNVLNKGSAAFKELPKAATAFKQLASALNAGIAKAAQQGTFQQASSNFKDWLNQIGSNQTAEGTEFKTLFGQAEMAIQTIKQAQKALSDIQEYISTQQGTVEPTELQQTAENLIAQSFKQNFFAKIAGMFQTKPFPGLDGNSLARELTAAIAKNPAELQTKVSELNQAMAEVDTAAVKDVDPSLIGKAAQSAQSTQPTTPTQETGTAQPATQTQQSTGTTNQPAVGSQPDKVQVFTKAINDLNQELSATEEFKNLPMKKLLAIMVTNGWRIQPPQS